MYNVTLVLKLQMTWLKCTCDKNLNLKHCGVVKSEGLPGVLGNKGTLAKYRREQGNISQVLGTGEQNSKNYSTKTFGKCVGTWEHTAILEGNKGTRTPPGRLSKQFVRETT